MPHLVVLSGAGISAESGIRTFRDGNGLWEEYHIEEVATPSGWERHPEVVLRFYNERRKQVRETSPNAAHEALVDLENSGFRVSILTQNIDDLHERAGSSDVIHLHGEIMKARSSINPRLVYRLEGNDIAIGDLCDQGSQLRPHVVWFGEDVPLYATACDIIASADMVLVVGTSLAVMPAAALINEAPLDAPCILVDPNAEQLAAKGVIPLATSATEGVSRLVSHWRETKRLTVPDELIR
ncbi:SIR2 family NAD-dependent protein deacylase [Phytohalomonas tamaricis]|uniref:SIR2 family NAD-dependent protein deacylase n=1 Tax=Phytohalomonas tamaricis TaxID=2081032 RepID=UPI0021D42292|nr:Sir2 family NAD-dependent protein deacetylase [Phytohalomonas tamaricis]